MGEGTRSRRPIALFLLFLLPPLAFFMAYGMGRVEEFAFVVLVYPFLTGLLVGLIAAFWVYIARISSRPHLVAITFVLSGIALGGLHLGRYHAAFSVFEILYTEGMAGSSDSDALSPIGLADGSSDIDQSVMVKGAWREFLLHETGRIGFLGNLALREQMGVRTHGLSAIPLSRNCVRLSWAVEGVLLWGILFQLVAGVSTTPQCPRCGRWLRMQLIGTCSDKARAAVLVAAIHDGDTVKALSSLDPPQSGILSMRQSWRLLNEGCTCGHGENRWRILDPAGIPTESCESPPNHLSG